MRLINTDTLEIHEFIDVRNAPDYVILSHCWGDGEVSFKEYTKGTIHDGPGYVKILECCAFAKSRNQRWLWVDTCCIDKRSSAELSEAINSMYEWYEQAEECYAYMADVTSSSLESSDESQKFRNSRWFKRGWTLQELIAPRHVTFLNRNWKPIGHVGPGRPRGSHYYRSWSTLLPLQESGPELTDNIATITGIPAALIKDADIVLSDFSAAQRLSWMKGRQTTRIEDSAYCLLGVFGVNMPLLYGEGARAFGRLQVEIVNRTGDESVFAFRKDYGKRNINICAEAPWMFDTGGNVRCLTTHDRPPLAISSQWAELHLTTQRPGVFCYGRDRTVYVVRLNCAKVCQDTSACPCMMFIKHAECGHFVRESSSLYRKPEAGLPTSILCEDNLENAADWIPVYEKRTIFIHLTMADMQTCTNTRGTTGTVCFSLE